MPTSPNDNDTRLASPMCFLNTSAEINVLPREHFNNFGIRLFTYVKKMGEFIL